MVVREELEIKQNIELAKNFKLLEFKKVYSKRPKVHFKKDGSLKPTAPKYVLKRPDIDNCLKFILDSLQPDVIIDDKLVVEVKIVKKWCNHKDEEKTKVELMTLQ